MIKGRQTQSWKMWAKCPGCMEMQIMQDWKMKNQKAQPEMQSCIFPSCILAPPLRWSDLSMLLLSRYVGYSRGDQLSVLRSKPRIVT